MLIVTKFLAKSASVTGIAVLAGALAFSGCGSQNSGGGQNNGDGNNGGGITGVAGITPTPGAAQLGVKTGLPAATSVLSSISATVQIVDIFSPACPTATGESAAALFASTVNGSQDLNYADDAVCAVQVTGGNGGYYLIGNEPEDFYSDDVAPSTYATVMHSWVQAILALDPQAHFIGPNLTSWTADTTNAVAYRYGPPTVWFASMVESYEQQYGAKPPFTALALHLYVTSDMYTDFENYAQPYLQTIRQFSASAVQYGYPAQIWMTEGMVMFNQGATQALSTAQQQIVTNYMQGMLTDPDVAFAYYFQSWPNVQGWQNGSESGRNAFPETASGVAQTPPTEVGTALLAAVNGAAGGKGPTSSTTVSCSPNPVSTGTNTTCTVTVTGSGALPQGTVAFEDVNAGGTFRSPQPSGATGQYSDPYCILTPGTSSSSCSITYTNSTAQTVSVSGFYAHDVNSGQYQDSNGQTRLTVGP